MLTDSERRTYEFIRAYIKEHGFSPKLPEIALGTGICSTGVVHRYIKALERKQLIRVTPRVHRGIQLTEKNPKKDFILPVLGTIAAGQPIEAIPVATEVDLYDIFAGDGRFLLRVKGDSMIDEGICDGDLIICQQTPSSKNDDIVVALIDNEEATLKRIHHNINGSVTLIPANSAYSPMTYPASRVFVQGIFIGLLRLSL